MTGSRTDAKVWRRGMQVALMAVCLFMAQSTQASEDNQQITVTAAASLTEVVDALGTAFRAASGISVRASYSSSAVAARQVINGAPFDLLLSANRTWIDEVARRRAIDTETITVIASNRLIIAGSTGVDPAASPVTIMNRAIRAGWRIAIADPGSVPAGIYARDALQSMELWERVRPLLVNLQNVRSVVAYIEHGETPIGFVYDTDVRIARHMHRVATFDATTYEPIEYVGAVPMNAPSPHAAKAFLAFINSTEGQSIIASYGFVPRGVAAQ